MAILDQNDPTDVNTHASAVVAAGGVANAGVDINILLYLHPSDNLGAMLVSAPFNGIGYHSWRRSVMRALSVNNKLGFIIGECKRPDSQFADYRQWVRCDDIVTLWILNSLSKDIADSVEYTNDAVELWRELEDRYKQTNSARLYQIQKEINDLTLGALNIINFYTKMKKLWEELSNLSMKAQCNCQYNYGAKEKLYKAEHDRHLI
uniref:Uncharacterized protein LOC104249914 n=1 Tax=Nicotiana sylvestris TaxID=4096 RepID=A0A1U7Z1G0_NICSY|nr:PREDICTED: uncharacterized protein LOC104249914 [Nicotiana sylvestris]